MNTPLHPDIAALAPLLGTWTGNGAGSYPTIEPFEYTETVTFGHVGKPFLSYVQRTADPTTGAPMHTESGYLRCAGPGHLELVLAHPTGMAEVAEGTTHETTDGTALLLRSCTMAATATAKPVRAVERDIDVAGDRLHYVLRMSAMGLPMTHHLEATLTRA